MAPGDRAEIVCPDCGAANRDGETVCYRCGQPLGAANAAKASAHVARVLAPASRRTFHISSLLLLIALIALCLGALRAQLVLGIVLSAVLLPAAVYTTIIASRSAATGTPMPLFEKLNRFGVAIAGTLVVEFAALVAFCITCVPVGFMAFSESGVIVACVVGGIAAIVAAVFVTRYLLTRKRRLTREAGNP
jgi:hypothetical protein